MAESEFKRERVLFHVVGQGSIEVEYEVGAETPEQAFRRTYDPPSFKPSALFKLATYSDLEYVITCSTEPDPLDIERAEGRQLESEQADYARAREDEADQWRMNR